MNWPDFAVSPPRLGWPACSRHTVACIHRFFYMLTLPPMPVVWFMSESGAVADFMRRTYADLPILSSSFEMATAIKGLYSASSIRLNNPFTPIGSPVTHENWPMNWPDFAASPVHLGWPARSRLTVACMHRFSHILTLSSWDPSDDHSPRMPQKHWSIPSYQVVSTIATAFSTVPQALSSEDCNRSWMRQPGWSRTKGSSITSLLCWGISSIGFPSVSESTSRSRSSSTMPSTIEARYTSAATAILSGRLAPGLTCDLLFEATWLYLEPGPVALGLEASVSPARLFGTRCPKTFDLRNCRWNVSNLRWKHIHFARHMPSSAHSAFVTWLRGAL